MPHTPGPWTISGTSVVANDVCIATIEDDGGYEAPPEERVANLKLIAASKDMLVFLEDDLREDERYNAVLRRLGTLTQGAEEREAKMRELIKRATGR